MSLQPKKLVQIRARVKARKPVFLRHNWWKHAKFRNNPVWRKPKGTDNKMRLQRKGYPPIVKIGYRGPRIARGLHPSGLIPVLVSSQGDLERLSPERHIIYISGKLGLRKRILIEKTAREKGFKIANPVLGKPVEETRTTMVETVAEAEK